MKKEEIYVPIANKKEAKRAKAVLEAMGERIFHMFMPMDDKEIYLLFEDDDWLIGEKLFGRTKITLKQLIELLVSEQKPTEPEKIAVRVDNEKEFNALMKYYDSLGWTTGATEKYTYSNGFNCYDFHDKYRRSNSVTQESLGYKIISFSEFAKEHGIRVPLLVSEDGVDLYQQDVYHCVKNIHNKGWKYCFENQLYPSHFVITDSEVCKAFSTRQSALDWIEAQKPKVIEYKVPNSNYTLSITKEEVSGFQRLSYLDFNDIKAIHKAMEGLNS